MEMLFEHTRVPLRRKENQAIDCKGRRGFFRHKLSIESSYMYAYDPTSCFSHQKGTHSSSYLIEALFSILQAK